MKTNRYNKQLTPLLHKYEQIEIDVFNEPNHEAIEDSKAKQNQYEIDRFLYRQNHENLSNQTMGRGSKRINNHVN